MIEKEKTYTKNLEEVENIGNKARNSGN